MPTTLPAPARAYIGSVAGLATVVLAVFTASSRGGAPADVLALALLTAAGIAALQFPVMIGPRYKAEVSFAVYLPVVLLYPAPVAVVAVALSRIFGEALLCVRHRRNPRSALFNTAQLVLAAAAASLTYGLVASTMDGPAALRAAVAGILAAAVLYTVSTALVVVLISIQLERSPLQTWLSVARVDLLQTAATFVVGVMLALLLPREPWVLLLLIAPIAVIQVSIRKSVTLAQQTIAAVEAMADVVDRRDPYTFAHSERVTDRAVAVAKRLRLAESDIELIRLAARVHDLGKIGIPDSVLHKEGRLTDAEFELMKQHPTLGAEILERYPEYRRGRELVAAHHERMDGLGYPRGLKGDAIPLGARIIAVADSWDAMTSDRPYRRALQAEVALGELERGKGTQWDARVVEAFFDVFAGNQPLGRGGWRRSARQPAVRALGAVVGLFAG